MIKAKMAAIPPAPTIVYTRSSLKESLLMLSVCSNTSVVVDGFKIFFLAHFRASVSEIPENNIGL